MRSVKIKDRQTFFDVAILSNGAPEAALKTAFDNGRSITDVLVSGEVINVPETFFFDEEIVTDLKAKNAIPATGDTDSFISAQKEGIGVWYIGLDFKVS